jgi:hypothetical protein
LRKSRSTRLYAVLALSSYYKLYGVAILFAELLCDAAWQMFNGGWEGTI